MTLYVSTYRCLGVCGLADDPTAVNGCLDPGLATLFFTILRLSFLCFFTMNHSGIRCIFLPKVILHLLSMVKNLLQYSIWVYLVHVLIAAHTILIYRSTVCSGTVCIIVAVYSPGIVFSFSYMYSTITVTTI
jgi:hypothetical protein